MEGILHFLLLHLTVVVVEQVLLMIVVGETEVLAVALTIQATEVELLIRVMMAVVMMGLTTLAEAAEALER